MYFDAMLFLYLVVNEIREWASPVESWDGLSDNEKSIKINLFSFIARPGRTKPFAAYCLAECLINGLLRDLNAQIVAVCV